MKIRNEIIQKIKTTNEYDVVVIGGGATGLGTALDSTLRGYKTLLLEAYDFAKGTSSRSTKLAHGGVRYLKQGDVSMVKEALRERGLMKENAPHLVHDQKFIVPVYDWWDAPVYTTGLKVYDVMAGKLGLGPSEMISKEETLKMIPNLNEEGLIGGVRYYDGQFDDARLAITLMQTIIDFEGDVINYTKVTGLLKEDNILKGVEVEDQETGESIQVNAKNVINATGVFVDTILKMDNEDALPSVSPSQGVHIILDKEFLKGSSSIMVPRTDDGRVLFAVPWYDKIVVGTTDTPMEEVSIEPVALEEEIEFILKTAKKYLHKEPKREDVKAVFAGLRPLMKSTDEDTKKISRSHKIVKSQSGLITVVGGKWTTYRQMSEDVINFMERKNEDIGVKCITKDVLLHGYKKDVDRLDVRSVYGNDLPKIELLIKNDPSLNKYIHPDLPYRWAEVKWGVENELARTVDDILSRRTRSLLFDAKASLEASSKVAEFMADLLGKDEAWIENQITSFKKLVDNYTC
ncbi:FAD-dependent oxidoreductase [Flammeovirga yaeyamensis]|uniref:FAD-dependent oxidoreductase n=1 Tax=Flammeovirga yaeyamensis TaxID=367791 RepID=A0AAX1N298_9BACT|nr:glycerol-3-phosphate dehydrogenase/oxidase [Flammeovirga yaeyamensis]MBB3696234.1 glycerol-3-phosphate dehydrogenase [Flammeovirga yaeyamensis]NMF34915.1 glycerol-3-phosphate dehydrogenase/oxidase [Flammeovirga yaeyamensis]QWG00260.1 FAD-dependent oxidoreductase [Flammeovirga yaeyamensis]